MLFITVDELKRRLQDPEIFFASMDHIDMSKYSFHSVYSTRWSRQIALGNKPLFNQIKSIAKDVVKCIIGKRYNLWRYMELSRCIADIDLMIDVSGFNLGKKWSSSVQESYLDNIRLAKKYQIPIVLMPQSFGPFDYPEEKRHLISEMAELLPYAEKIFAREKEGYQLLLDTFHLSNVELSADLVLQNNGIDLKHIYQQPPASIQVPYVKPGTVGIVPNKQCFNHGDQDRILSLYRATIESLIAKGKEICIIRHSSEDLVICRELSRMFAGNESVRLIEDEFSCLEYDRFVKQFDFIICSRYHGAVHAYRNCVPCVLLGWAVKYAELAELLGQRDYAFDITDAGFSEEKIIEAVEHMCESFGEESKEIGIRLKKIQSENCFDKALRSIPDAGRG